MSKALGSLLMIPWCRWKAIWLLHDGKSIRLAKVVSGSLQLDYWNVNYLEQKHAPSWVLHFLFCETKIESHTLRSLQSSSEDQVRWQKRKCQANCGLVEFYCFHTPNSQAIKIYVSEERSHFEYLCLFCERGNESQFLSETFLGSVGVGKRRWGWERGSRSHLVLSCEHFETAS